MKKTKEELIERKRFLNAEIEKIYSRGSPSYSPCIEPKSTKDFLEIRKHIDILLEALNMYDNKVYMLRHLKYFSKSGNAKNEYIIEIYKISKKAIGGKNKRIKELIKTIPSYSYFWTLTRLLDLYKEWRTNNIEEWKEINLRSLEDLERFRKSF